MSIDFMKGISMKRNLFSILFYLEIMALSCSLFSMDEVSVNSYTSLSELDETIEAEGACYISKENKMVIATVFAIAASGLFAWLVSVIVSQLHEGNTSLVNHSGS